MGYLVNTLPSPVTLNPHMSFGELIKKEKELLIATSQNQIVRFYKIVEALKPKRDPSYTPIFQVLFNFVNQTMNWELSLPGLKVTPLEEERPFEKGAKYDLSFMLVECQDGQIRGELEYSTGLFDKAAMDHFISDYISLTEKAIKDPTAKLEALDHALPRKKVS